MSFYSVWEDAILNGIDDVSFLQGFIMNIDPVKEITEIGSKEELTIMMETLTAVNRDHLIAYATKLGEKKTIKPADVPCFSTFDNGAYRLNELLEFAPDGLQLHEIGYQLRRSGSVDARIKYGENHSELASRMGIVNITKSRPFIVKNTALGAYLTEVSVQERKPLLRAMLFQDAFVQYFISQINKPDPMGYRDIVRCLSDSTAYRRRTSVKQMMEFVLVGTSLENKLQCIDWQV